MESTTSELRQSRGVIEAYREFLPVSPSTPIVSLAEGNAPLVYGPQLSERVGRGCQVFVKNEGVNPTGSFKDRGMTVAVSKAMERGAKALICASTGNTSASAAAYAARGNSVHRCFACRKNRKRKIGASLCLRSQNRRDRWQF